MGGEALGVFLFTDVVGSTRLWAEHTEAMRTDLAAHDELLRAAIARHDGTEFSTAGDSFAAVFGAADDAVDAAVDAQTALAAHAWAVPGGIGVRMGVHAGSAQRRGGDWFGPPLNETARIMGTGHAGQVVASDAVVGMLRRGYETRDLGEHRLRDLDGLWRLHQVDVPGAPNEHPPLRSLQTGRTTLPTRRTALIGRERLVGELQHLLGQHRLVTLVGPGGAGKTHSAVEAAGRMLPTVRDGVFFVDLTRAPGDDDVVAAFVDGLGMATPPETDPLEALADHLAPRELLLVVDNCEHVIDAAAEVVDELLQHADGVRVLATSREALDLDGEHLHRIPPLDAASGSSPAVRLFVERALGIDADLVIDADALGTISEIARRLDGMPLAIELAAARTRTLSPAQILEHLSDRFRLLTGGRQRGRQRRQQTLEAAIDWSYDLLDADEQRAFRLLSTCAGGFTLVTAARLLDVDEITALDLIDSLVAKSLVTAADVGELRCYRLLETLREYGQSRLAAAGELEAAVVALEEALAPPPEIRSDWDLVIREYGEWTDRTAAEAATRRNATGQAMAAGRLEHAAMLAFSATSPDEPGALEQQRSLVEEIVRRADELGDLGWWYASVSRAFHNFFTGRGAACLRVCEEGCASLPEDDPRRAPFEAWRIFVLGSIVPTAQILVHLERTMESLRLFAEPPYDFAICAAETTWAARLALAGRDADALAHSREAVAWGTPGHASEAQALTVHLRLTRRAGLRPDAEHVARAERLRDRDIGIQNLVPIWDAVSVEAPIEDRVGRLLRLARRRQLGRYHQEWSQFLVAFAHLALELGDVDRARDLTEVAMPYDVPTYWAHYEARAAVEGWGDDFEAGFAAEVRRIYSHEHLQLAEKGPAVLADELARWDEVLAGPA